MYRTTYNMKWTEKLNWARTKNSIVYRLNESLLARSLLVNLSQFISMQSISDEELISLAEISISK